VPFATVGTRLLRARRKLRELLSERVVQRQAPVTLMARATAGVGKRVQMTARRGQKSCGKSASLAA
jgi:hypothetical protein